MTIYKIMKRHGLSFKGGHVGLQSRGTQDPLTLGRGNQKTCFSEALQHLTGSEPQPVKLVNTSFIGQEPDPHSITNLQL